jgi:hypothetical protein
MSALHTGARRWLGGDGQQMVTPGEFDLGERSELEVLRANVADSQDQLRRARQRLERAERRVKNLEVAFESWTLLLAQYEHAVEHGPDLREPRQIRI